MFCIPWYTYLWITTNLRHGWGTYIYYLYLHVLICCLYLLVNLHVRIAHSFLVYISVTTWRIVLEFNMRLGTDLQCIDGVQGHCAV